MSNMFLKPAVVAGEVALVRDPQTMIPLAEDGEWKTPSNFWRRRIRDKEVIDATPVEGAEPVAAPVAPQFEPCAVCLDPHACALAGQCQTRPQ